MKSRSKTFSGGIGTDLLYDDSHSLLNESVYDGIRKQTTQQFSYIIWNIIRWIIATTLLCIALNNHETRHLKNNSLIDSCCDCYNLVMNGTITSQIYWNNCDLEGKTCKSCSNDTLNSCPDDKFKLSNRQQRYIRYRNIAMVFGSYYIVVMLVLLVLLLKCKVSSRTWVMNHVIYFILMTYNAAFTVFYLYYIYGIYMFQEKSYNDNVICLESQVSNSSFKYVRSLSLAVLVIVMIIPCFLSCFRVLFRICQCYGILKVIYAIMEQIISILTVLILIVGLLSVFIAIIAELNFKNYLTQKGTPIIEDIFTIISAVLLLISNIDIFLWEFGRDLSHIYCCICCCKLKRERLLRYNSIDTQSDNLF